MKETRNCLKDFKFKELFQEHLLWDRFNCETVLLFGEDRYQVTGVGQKEGVVAIVCCPSDGDAFPGSAERKRIDRELSKSHHEHIVIFVDREKTRQIWTIPDASREGRSARVKLRTLQASRLSTWREELRVSHFL